MIFVNSMSDLFHCDVPLEFAQRVFLTMRETPHHTYQVLTNGQTAWNPYRLNLTGLRMFGWALALRIKTTCAESMFYETVAPTSNS